MTRITATNREHVQNSEGVVSGHPVSFFVAVDSGQGPAGNNAFSILDEGLPAGRQFTEAVSMCSRNPFRTVRKHGRLINYRPDCGCWHCSECLPKLREKWIRHAEKVIGEAGYLNWGYVVVDADAFDNIARRLRRLSAKYFRVRLPHGTYILFVGVKFGWSPDLIATTSDRVLESFTKLVNDIQDARGGNPISSSHAWSLPSREHSDWDLIAVGPTPNAVKIAAAVAEVLCVERQSMVVCSGDVASVDRLCDLIAVMSKRHVKPEFKRNENLDTDDQDSGSWRGFPDEEPDPYRVGVT